MANTEHTALDGIPGWDPEPEVWIDWRIMHPLVDPASLDRTDRRLTAAMQAHPNANRPIPER